MAQLVLCQVDRNTRLPLFLYLGALGARPVSHVDRPSTLIQLAGVHFARFDQSKEEVEMARAEALLREAMELSPGESHGNRVAMFMLRLYGGRIVDSVQQSCQSSLKQESTARSRTYMFQAHVCCSASNDSEI